MKPYDDTDRRHHRLRQRLVAWRHQAINWPIVDLSSKVYSAINLRVISQGVLKNLTSYFCSEIIGFRWVPHLPVAIGLIRQKIFHQKYLPINYTHPSISFYQPIHTKVTLFCVKKKHKRNLISYHLNLPREIWFQIEVTVLQFSTRGEYSTSQCLYTQFAICCVLLWLEAINFTHILQDYFTDTEANILQ